MTEEQQSSNTDPRKNALNFKISPYLMDSNGAPAMWMDKESVEKPREPTVLDYDEDDYWKFNL